MKKKKKWYRLDNAATIYPVVMNRKWMAMFRLCATLDAAVDREVLARALKKALRRMPMFNVCVKRGFFWFYFEELSGIPPIEEDVANPCLPIDIKQNNGFLFRVRCHENRIALEFFHVLTDGTGGMRFLKTLVAEYLSIKYGLVIPRDEEILDCSEPPKAKEMEDNFRNVAGEVTLSRGEPDAYRITGTEEYDQFMNIVTGIADIKVIAEKARAMGVSVTHYLAAIMIQSIGDIQKKEWSRAKRHKPIKICVPVNLRNIFPCQTLRNFSSYVNPGLEYKYGDYSLREIAHAVKCYMGLEATPQKLRAKLTANVEAELHPVLRRAPLFIKILTMRAVYRATGDVQSSALLSNLGTVTLPHEMEKRVTRFDFQLGPLFQNKVTCGLVSYKGKAYINFTRTIRETDTERGFFMRLVEEGVPVTIESNTRERKLMESCHTA
ncbi:MAG TPA: hypothetical protein VN540_10830 [Clostridia bacterium]|nr:hypothetical protein [Clostridia bacterium]